ncbi:hypothetical protein Syun_006974 [Stephania yunnanensis]|uniref:Uncharacterized protein n=1 Tax=Stephania yunnanensis TaxID=152371 RepID=A0AAP0KXN4_9MAGN
MPRVRRVKPASQSPRFDGRRSARYARQFKLPNFGQESRDFPSHVDDTWRHFTGFTGRAYYIVVDERIVPDFMQRKSGVATSIKGIDAVEKSCEIGEMVKKKSYKGISMAEVFEYGVDAVDKSCGSEGGGVKVKGGTVRQIKRGEKRGVSSERGW